MTVDHYAKEAARILADETFKFALDQVRTEALEDLARADARDMTAVLRLQQKIVVIDEIRSELRGATLRRSDANSGSAGTFA